MIFKKTRKYVLEKIKNEILLERIDKDILPLIEVINSKPCYVTLSSCSGRIVVLNLPKFGAKKECKFIGKWHKNVETEKVEKSLRKCKEEGWFLMQPPILHVRCKTLEDAEKLLRVANESGFRESGIISLRKNIVRIYSSERIETLLAKSGKILVSKEYLKTLVEVANEKIKEVKMKVESLRKNLESWE